MDVYSHTNQSYEISNHFRLTFIDPNSKVNILNIIIEALMFKSFDEFMDLQERSCKTVAPLIESALESLDTLATFYPIPNKRIMGNHIRFFVYSLLIFGRPIEYQLFTKPINKWIIYHLITRKVEDVSVSKELLGDLRYELSLYSDFFMLHTIDFVNYLLDNAPINESLNYDE